MSKKERIPIVTKELLFPFIVITSLFALWGIANDLTNPMVSAFKKVMPELSNIQSSLVQFAFYFGYFFMAFPAALFIRRFSYKSGIILGLTLYAIGAFLFYPAAIYEEFNYFLISLWVITCGLAFLETTANPLILALGDKRTATQRLNLAQAFNPVGSLTGMIIAQVFVLSALRSDDYSSSAYNALSLNELAAIRENDLSIISIPYLSLGVLVLIIMSIIVFTKIPKTHAQDKMSVSDSLSKLFTNKSYKMGVLAQAACVGSQIMCWTYIFHYVDNLNEVTGWNITATNYNVAAMVLFLTGRWIGTALMKNIDPPKVLMFFGAGGALASIGAIILPGMMGLLSLVGISVFMSIMFPTIYGIALKGMGDEVKIGSAGLVMAIVGGALMPIVQAAILDLGGDGFNDLSLLGYIPEINLSFILPAICLAFVGYYGYTNIKRLTKV